MADRETLWQLQVAAVRYEVAWALSKKWPAGEKSYPPECARVAERAAWMEREALAEIREIARQIVGQKEGGS